MATLTAQTITTSGIVPAPVAVSAGGDEYDNTNSNVFLEVFNDHVSASRTITIATQKTLDGLSVSDRDITITAANGSKIMGPFSGSYYNDGDGLVQLTYSDSGADMRIVAYKLG